MRKLLTLMLALALVLSLAPSAFAEDVYTLDYYWVGNGDNAVRADVEKAINEYIEPLIGANVVFHIVGWNDWITKAVTALQSGEKIDIIFTADWREYMLEVTGGLLLPLNDDNGPYGNLYEQYGAGIDATINPAFITGTQVNGVTYGIATNKELCVPEGFIINVDAAKAIGWDVVAEDPSITCTEDIEPWLAAYKEMYPEKYPYVTDGSSGRWADEPWCPDWAGLEMNSIAMKMALKEDGTPDETIYSIFETEEQQEHIRLMYKWGQAGYINPDQPLTSFDYTSIFNAGDFLVYSAPLKGNNIKAMEMKNASGNPNLNLVEITLQPKYVVTTHSGGSMLAIPTTSQDPVKAMQYINLMHSDAKLINMMLYGVEGVQWEVTDTNQVNLIDSSWNGAHGGAWTIGNTKLQLVTTSEDPLKNELLQSYANDAVPTFSLGFRFVQTDVAVEIGKLYNVVDEYAKPLMCGAIDPDDPERGIDAMVAKLDEAGIDVVLEEIQEQFDAWVAASK